MKKSKYIELVLITAALASCNKPLKDRYANENKTYLRSDTTAPYSRANRHHYSGGAGLWYYAFRPYGNSYNGSYSKAGYYSDGINERSNVGQNSYKSNIVRGGFGSSSYSVSS